MNTTKAEPTAKPTKLSFGADEIRDILADSKVDTGVFSGRPTVMSMRTIAVKLLGFDPTRGENTDPAYGGHTPDFYFNKHLSMTALRRTLDGLVEDGVAAKVTEPTYYSTKAEKRINSIVHFPHGVKSGYVLAEHFETSVSLLEAKARNKQREDILVAARAEIAAKYDAEVQALYATQCAAAGIDTTPETTTVEG